MTLLALGINHRTATVAVREQVAFTPTQLESALAELRSLPHISEAAVLSTCNRTELYCVTDAAGEQTVLDWLGRFHNLRVEELTRCAYHYHDNDAARHLMRVAVGLDSMVLGEPQILGQLKEAYQQARQAKGLGGELERLFQHTFAVAKQVRTETGIGKNPVSVAYAAVSMASRIFDDFSRANALLIGAGETIELVARHLHEAGVRQLTVANRTRERAERVSSSLGGTAITLPEIPDALERADIVISSTASPLPILGKGMVERALKKRRHRPVFMVDIAVPRDIEPEVGELADVFLYTVDDLEEVIEENRRHRQVAADQAESLIEHGVGSWQQERRVRNGGEVIRDFRRHGESLRDQARDQALERLAKGEDPAKVVERLAHQLANRFMHQPTLTIREAAAQENHDLLSAAPRLLLPPKPAFEQPAPSAKRQKDDTPA
ncbi:MULTISPECIES: glutamyl-tRNA reductase [Halomonadaceae]|jgi:glutamyl-tRNA reductase|uniref:Glutamyl-tRNA reductase n=1 Tax=Vreelandella piezotolerans TaxID=2609667 RepID=A0ABQ6XF29_9GAMM|nr:MULTISPECIES: glutamyl-tRNA reductase [Halomonas]KFC51674.1 glutamyl-tRNA reductase [Halomonas sp. SUBG004]KAE8440140.1 glutamyl-tRNA reductase [Halomonas piezotolerans]MCG7590771.1 glutamyl-tRNA reductase [Halomonas sp. McD50-5]MCG7616883.1 glutamyl-tRNA reductase [Halomonas sp. McD50-4]QJA23675.1 glutamyl-tRNA reductase [Halomonas piezotolerans]